MLGWIIAAFMSAAVGIPLARAAAILKSRVVAVANIGVLLLALLIYLTIGQPQLMSGTDSINLDTLSHGASVNAENELDSERIAARLTELRHLYEDESDIPQRGYDLLVALVLAEREDEARKLYQELTAQRGPDATALLLWAKAVVYNQQNRQGDKTSAGFGSFFELSKDSKVSVKVRELLLRSYELDKNNWETLWLLGRDALQSGEQDVAGEWLEQIDLDDVPVTFRENLMLIRDALSQVSEPES